VPVTEVVRRQTLVEDQHRLTAHAPDHRLFWKREH
jgi:hypothetical protein